MSKTLLILAVLFSLDCGLKQTFAHDEAEHDHASEHQLTHGSEKTTKQQPSGPHGGNLQDVGALQMETVVGYDGIQVYIYDQAERPVDSGGARGLASLQVDGAAKRYRYDLFSKAANDDSAKSLGVSVDLTPIAGQQVSIDFQLVGVPHSNRKRVAYSQVAIVPMTPQQTEAAAIARQKVCPVSNLALGSMGKAIAVSVEDQTIYVCCEGCINAVKSDPSKYLAAMEPFSVAPATEVDAESIVAQKTCPVSDAELGSMGMPLKAMVQGRNVFLCCRGCVKPLEDKPSVYLAKLDGAPVTTPASEKTMRHLNDAEQAVAISVNIKGMQCAHCVKHVTETLQEQRGVGEVQIDLKAGQAVVLPKNLKQSLSPQLIWDAVAKSGYTPLKMTGADGEFSERPSR